MRSVVVCAALLGVMTTGPIAAQVELATLPVGQVPDHVVLTPDGALALVSAALETNLTVIDVAARQVVDQIPLPGRGSGIAVTPDGSRAVVAIANIFCSTSAIAIVDLVARAVTATIPMPCPPGFPHRIAITPDGAQALVTLQNSTGVLAFVDLHQNLLSGLLPMSGGISNVLVTPDGATALVSSVEGPNYDLSKLYFVDVASRVVVDHMPVDDDPSGIALSPDASLAILATNGDSGVQFIDLATRAVVGSVPVRNRGGVAILSDGTTALATALDGELAVIDIPTRSIVRTIPLESGMHEIAVNPTGTIAVVTNRNGNSVTLFSLGCGNGTIDVGEECDDGNTLDGDCCSSICQYEDDGASCMDGDACTMSDTCQAGTCIGADLLDCNDANACTADFCDPMSGCINDDAPASGCLTAGKSLLLIKNASSDSKDKLLWKWVRGGELTQDDLADPRDSAVFGLCVYAGSAQTLVSAASLPPDAAGWRTLSNKGYRFSGSSPDGISLAFLKGGAASKSKAVLKGEGEALADPSLPLAYPVTVQLKKADSPLCLESTFTADGEARNDAAQFRAKE